MIKHINESDFEKEVTNAKTPVLVDFYGTWCMPCRMMASVLEDVEKSMGDKIKICKVDIDENMDLARKYGVMSVPTIYVFKDGEEVEKFVGLRQKKQIIDAVTPFMD